MQADSQNPYVLCPTFTSDRFLLRGVTLEDAQDLLECYADPASAKIFNSDNCTSNFIYHTLEEMQACIRSWLADYAWCSYVRFSIVDQTRQKAVGTIEFFAKSGLYPGFGRVGLLRLDLPSSYETANVLGELVRLIETHFPNCFGVDTIITKAIPLAAARVQALKKMGYQALESQTIQPLGDYYAITPRASAGPAL